MENRKSAVESMDLIFSDIFDGVYNGKRVLITGHTGFKGSWMSLWLNELNAEVYGYALEPKSEDDNFVMSNLEKYIHHQVGDIRDFDLLKKYIKEIQPEFIFHFAAQPLVLESYNTPHTTFETNLMGTLNLLEIIRKEQGIKVFINVTSDKCYKNVGKETGYVESDQMGGEDPYSASKGCSELLTASYYNSFFKTNQSCKIASVRAGNVIGGGDWGENRIIPDFIRSLKSKNKVIVRNPNSIRPWQFVLEPLSGYLLLASGLYQGTIKSGEGWNFGPSEYNDFTVIQLIEKIISHLGEGSFQIAENIQARYEEKILRLDTNKAKDKLSWKQALSLEETIEYTMSGYMADLKDNNVYQNRITQIKNYVDAAFNRKIKWASNFLNNQGSKLEQLSVIKQNKKYDI